MTPAFRQLELPAENTQLISFLSSGHWPFHGNERISPEKAEAMLRDGLFDGANHRTFWIIGENDQKLGLIRLFDLEDIGDGTPLFDLRLIESARGHGIGLQALRWLTDYFFRTWPELDRVEGNTRSDNTAMKKLFRKCHYAKEGHHRRAWKAADKTLHDAIHFAILRDDWEQGKVTPVPWEQD